MEHIKDVLKRILDNMYIQKEVFTFNEACRYCGISTSKMYKYTSTGGVPHFKPNGKLIYFKKAELDEWLLRNRQSTNEEMQRIASKYSLNKK